MGCIPTLTLPTGTRKIQFTAEDAEVAENIIGFVAMGRFSSAFSATPR